MIYFITNRKLVKPERFLPIIQEAVLVGVGTLILREKDLNDNDLLKLAQEVKEITKDTDTSLIINGNAQVAKEVKAEGLQMSFKDFMQAKPEFIGLIGVSVHSLEEALLAAKNGADYLLASHIFQTDCKKGLAPKGIDWLSEITSSVEIPVIALGGIKVDNIKDVLKTQVKGVALMSAIMCASDVTGFINKLDREIKKSLF